MFFVDCDTASLESQELISTEAPTQNPLLRFITWIDPDAPRLAFHVAMIHWENMRTDFCESFIAGIPSLIIHPDPTTASKRGTGRQCSGRILRNPHFEGLNNDYFIQLKVISTVTCSKNKPGTGFSISIIPLSPRRQHHRRVEIHLHPLHYDNKSTYCRELLVVKLQSAGGGRHVASNGEHSRPSGGVELRDDIVARLDIKDVLSLSLACKHFRTVMESRQTWVRFVHKTQSQPHISKMEEPLEDYTTQELKDWTVRRHKARQCFRSFSRVTRHYIQGTDRAEESVLLPGGRWLLFEKYPGNLCYADCDALCPEAQSLIVLEDVVPDRIRTQFVIWRDLKSPGLTLRVAILYWHDQEDGRSYQTHFCKIDLVGHGSSAKLVAELLHQYQGSITYMETSDEGIRGQYFYQVHHVSIYGISARLANRQAKLEILNYGNGSSVASQVKLVDFYYSLHMWRFDILPDGRIVVSGATEVVIYFDPLPIVGDGIKTLAPSHAIKILGFPMRGEHVNMSKWYFGQELHIMVFGCSGKQMVVALIPHDGAPPMTRTIEKQMPTITGLCNLGLFLGAAMISRSCISLFSYLWGDIQSEVGSERMETRIFNVERDLHVDDDKYDVGKGDFQDVHMQAFNEEIGRVIIQDQQGGGYFVVDTT